MYISLKWLKKYLPEFVETDTQLISDKLTATIAEVEQVIPKGEGLKDIVIGQVTKVEKHKKNEKLLVCEVNDGKGKLQIVCGAANVTKDAYVAVCRAGGSILNPKDNLGSQESIQIDEVELKGVKSQGMICSLKELGLADEHQSIWILPKDSIVGEDLTEMLQDDIFEIENKAISHRPDVFSHEGLARELATIFDTPFKEIDDKTPLIPTKEVKFDVEVKNKELNPRFSAIVLANIKVHQSPAWVQISLYNIGERPINNIVDATNYIMMDMGQPMHAFDYNKIKSGKLIVRNADNREVLKTLDGEKRKLTKDMLVVADKDGALSVAGVIGGESSEVTDKTKNIVLEAANWEMYNIRRTSRDLGIRTEASTRFEKGQDPNKTQEAIERSIHLISDIGGGGEVASEFKDIYDKPREVRTLEFDLNNVKRLLGIELTKDEIINILKNLQIDVEGAEKIPANFLEHHAEGNKVILVIPTFRSDLNIQEDIVEEIGRIYGYAKIKATLPNRAIRAANKNPKREFIKLIKETFTSLGLDEIYTYAFVGEEVYEKAGLDIKKCIRVTNPLSPELEYVRNSIIPSHLDKLELNLSNFDEFGYFEIDRVALKEKNEEKLPKQPRKVSGLVTSKLKDTNIYLEIKPKIDELLNRLNVNKVSYKNLSETSENNPLFHPARSAQILSGGKELGLIGELHPVAAANYDITAKVAIFELDLPSLIENSNNDVNYTAVPILQGVKRDISFWVDKKTSAQDIEETLDSSKPKLVSKINISDIFEDVKKADEKSVTITVNIQPENKTLEDKEINKIVGEIIKQLETKFKAKVRKE